ncbi:DNA-directed RNA polymerase I subunit RPA49-like [Argonauta hians]
MFQVKEERPMLTIATFSHGKLKKKKRKKIKFKSYEENHVANGKRKRILVGKTDSICYVGDNYSEENPSTSNMYKHYVGVYNKATGKMQICDVEMFNLHPSFPGNHTEAEDATDSLNLSRVEQKLKLTNTFGSVSARRNIDQYKKTIVDGTMLDEAIDGVLDQSLRTEADTPAENGEVDSVTSGLLPPCNRSATSPEEAYKLDDIISPAEMGCLYEYSQDILHFKPENLAHLTTENMYCSSVLDRLQSLPEVGSPERETKACCLQYLQYLVQFQQMTQRSIKSKNFLTQFPPIVCKQFIEKFLLLVRNTKGVLERKCTSELQDKLLIHILILLLIIDNFSMSYSDVQRQLNIKCIKLNSLLSYIGCVTAKTKGVVDRKIVLKTPIKPMKANTRSKSRH